MTRITMFVFVIFAVIGCTTTPVSSHCSNALPGHLDRAISEVEQRLASGCEYQFDSYFQQLLILAEQNPDSENKMRFSDHLLRANDMGVISQRQAREYYNRFFNVKFVSLSGDYNTCAQACPVQGEVMANMRNELRDKQVGLLKASDDKAAYYRADHLLKEADLVLEATCRACAAGTPGAGSR
ncbi:MAG: hypothetical protein ACFHXK_17445 [bacterium]